MVPADTRFRSHTLPAVTTLSTKLYDEASRLFPGGVNSPVRAWRNVDGSPLFITRARGATVTDADGRTYRDFVGSWGAAIAGHAHPIVVAAVNRAAGEGLGFGAPTPSEIALARSITEGIPSIERIRMVNSGTEATMSGYSRGSRVHWSHEDSQVRGVLSRTFGRITGARRVWSADVRDTRQRWSAGVGDFEHLGRRVQHTRSRSLSDGVR
jgi:hypothetical protein